MKVIVDAVMASEQLKVLNTRLSELEATAKKAGGALPQVEKASGAAASKMLILGQFVDDAQYGLRGVVNNMPQVVQAFGGTMGLAGAVGIAAVGVSQLYDAYQKYDAIQQQTTSNLSAWRGALDDVDRVLRDGVNKRTDDLRKLLIDAQTELRNFGKTAKEITLEEQKTALALSQKQLETLDKNLPAIEKRAIDAGRKISQTGAWAVGMDFSGYLPTPTFTTGEEQTQAAREEYETQSRMVSDLKSRRAALTDAIKSQSASVSKLAEEYAKLKKKEDEATAGKKGAKEKDKFEKAWDEAGGNVPRWKREREAKLEQYKQERADALAQIEEDRKIAAERISLEEKAREKAQRDKEKAEEKHLSRLHDLQGDSVAERLAFSDIAKEHEMKNLDQLKDHELKTLKERINEQAKFYEQLGQMATQATTLAIGLSREYIDMRITGAEHAEEIIAQKFIKGVGDQLVAIGTKNLIEGAGMSLLGDPRGPGMLGIGATALAVGAGMGAGATAWGHTMNGGTVGQALPDKTAKDRGASPRSSSGGGSGGPLVINVSYGVGGPLPEDTAREIARVMRTGDRRRGAA